MRAVLAATLAACASCARTWSYEEFDSVLRTSNARTIVHEPGFSLYSPFGPSPTQTWVVRVSDADARLSRCLGGHERPWIVVLAPHEELRPDVRVSDGSVERPRVRTRPACGIAAFAAGRSASIYVAPPVVLEFDDREPLTVLVEDPSADATLMHELSHVFLNELEIDAPWWLSEGFAHLVEDAPVRDEVLALDEAGSTAEELSKLAEEDLDLARTLAFREDVAALARGQPHPHPNGRRVARGFVQYQLSRSGEPLVERLRKLAETDRSELLAAEPAWREWLRSHRDAGNAPGDH